MKKKEQTHHSAVEMGRFVFVGLAFYQGKFFRTETMHTG